ncbi:MAG: transglutaminase N-terminal domain-containing protein, partial [Pseudomonadota bacterium]
MILNVRHRTRYEYANDAAFSQHLLRLTPHAPPGQRVLDSALKIEPEPESIDTHRDVFGNRVHVATVSRPHGTLDIISTARIDRRERGGLILDASQSWEQCRDVALGTNGTAPPADVAAFAFPSHMTGATAAIEAYGR